MESNNTITERQLETLTKHAQRLTKPAASFLLAALFGVLNDLDHQAEFRADDNGAA